MGVLLQLVLVVCLCYATIAQTTTTTVAPTTIAPTTTTTPLPPIATPLPLGPDGYTIKELGHNLFYLTDSLYSMMFLIHDEGVIAVDAPPTIGANILKAIASKTDKPITHVIYSHGHSDHIGAAYLYPKSAIYISHKKTKQQVLSFSDPSRPVPWGTFTGGKVPAVPTVTFSDSYKLKVSSQVLELSYPLEDHEPGNIYIWAPKQKVLMHIDVIFPGWVPFKNLAVADNARNFIKAHDVILSFPFTCMISGHYGRPATRADVKTQRAYFQDIIANAIAAFKAVPFPPLEPNVERVFDNYFNQLTDYCAQATLVKWLGVLGGADVWTASHCFPIIESLRID